MRVRVRLRDAPHDFTEERGGGGEFSNQFWSTFTWFVEVHIAWTSDTASVNQSKRPAIGLTNVEPEEEMCVNNAIVVEEVCGKRTDGECADGCSSEQPQFSIFRKNR